MEQPIVVMATQPATVSQNQRKYRWLVPDATPLRHANGPAYFCMDLYRNGAARNHPKIGKQCIVVVELIQFNGFTHIQAGQAIPTENVLASFTHHLGTAFVFFDRNATHWTAFYQIWVKRNANAVVNAAGRQSTTILFARNVRMPL